MKIWDITIDENHDVDGEDWTLRIRAECDDGPDCEFLFHMPRDVAKALHQQVKLNIDPSIREEEEARAAYQRRDPDWMPKDVQQAEAQALVDDGVYKDDPAKLAWAESVAKGEVGL